MAGIGEWLRWLGLAITLVVTLVVTYSIVRGGRRQQQAAVGRSSPFLRSPWLMILMLAAYGVVMVLLWRPVLPALSERAGLALSVLGVVLMVAGAAFIFWGRIALGASHNVSSGYGVKLFADHHLVTSGPYRLVRHPMYFGFFVMLAGALLLYRTWTLVFIVLHGAVFIRRGARLEEQAMLERFGEEYAAYRRQVPAFFPLPSG